MSIEIRKINVEFCVCSFCISSAKYELYSRDPSRYIEVPICEKCLKYLRLIHKHQENI